MKYLENFLLLFFICIASSISYGQSANESRAQAINESKGEYCESNNSLIDGLKNALRSSQENILFVISQGGTNENLTTVKIRLEHTRFVLQKIKGFDDKRVVFAVADNIKGQGKLEFYVGNQLFLKISVRKNKPVCFLTPDYQGRKN